MRATLTALGRRWWSAPLVVFLVARLAGWVILAVLAREQGSVTAHPGMQVTEPKPAAPGYLGVVTNWDGQWYQQIAEHGYPRTLPRDEDGVVESNAWAFCPLYPALARLVMSLGIGFAPAAVVVSLLAALGATLLLFAMVQETGGRSAALLAVVALNFFPSAPVLQAAFTEGLALLLVLVCVAALARHRYGGFCVAVLLLGLTRPIAAPMAALMLVHAVLRWREARRSGDPLPVPTRWWLAGSVAAAVVATPLWPAVAALGTGEPAAYSLTQASWQPGSGADGWHSWLSGLWGVGTPAAVAVGLLGLGLLAGAVLHRSARVWGSGLRWWAPLYVGYLLLGTRPTTSVFRYALVSVVPAWPAGVVPQLPRPLRIAVLAGIAVVGVVLQVLWARSYLVLGPHGKGWA